MIRDKENLDFELMDEAFDEAHDAPEAEEENDGGVGAGLIARYERERGNLAQAEKWETRAQILAHAAYIREARAELRAEMAELDEREAA